MNNSVWTFKSIWPLVDKVLNDNGLSKGKSPTQVVAKICDVGESTVRSWIEDGRQPKTNAMVSLADGLGISMNQLISGELIVDSQEVATEYEINEGMSKR